MLEMNERRYLKDLNMQNTCWTCLKTEDNVATMSCDEVIWLQKQTSWTENAIQFADIQTRQICVICRQMVKKCINFTAQCQKALQIIIDTEVSGKDNTNYEISFQSIYNFNKNFFSTGICFNNTECGLILKSEQENCKEIEFNYANNGCQNYEFQHSNTDERLINYVMHNINGPLIEENYIDVDNSYDLSDDDLPLKMIRKRESETNKKKRKSLRNKKSMKSATDKMIKHRDSSINGNSIMNNHNDKCKMNANNGFSTRMVQETDEYTVIKLTKEQVIAEMRVKASSDQYTRSLYKCVRCVKGFNFEEVLKGHLNKHSQDNGDFKCDICEQYCPSAVSLRGHMKSHTTRYECKICGTVRLSRQHLLEHYGLSHTGDASTYSCEHCSFVTKKRTVIQRHVRGHTSGARHACALCGRLYSNIATLRVHAARHDKSKSLQCDQCSRKFIYPSLLQKHILSVHERSDYYCVECDIRFKSPDNLRLHFKKAKRHRDPSSYTHECPECSDKFISAASLSVHLTTSHGQPKTHACHLCPRLYSNKESLHGHVRRRHTNTHL